MYVPEDMCMVGDRKPFTGDGTGYFIHDDGHMIPRNDVLIVLSSDQLKKTGAEHFLFNDFVTKNDRLR